MTIFINFRDYEDSEIEYKVDDDPSTNAFIIEWWFVDLKDIDVTEEENDQIEKQITEHYYDNLYYGD